MPDANASLHWFRWWVGTAADPKLATVAKRSRQKRIAVIAVWATLLESAASTNDGGRFDLPVDEIAVMLEMKPDQVELILSALVERGLIIEGRIANWEKRQFASDYSTARVRKHRRIAGSRSVTGDSGAGRSGISGDETFQERFSNGDETFQERYVSTSETFLKRHVTPSETETETEAEGETRARARATPPDSDFPDSGTEPRRLVPGPSAQEIEERNFLSANPLTPDHIRHILGIVWGPDWQRTTTQRKREVDWPEELCLVWTDPQAPVNLEDCLLLLKHNRPLRTEHPSQWWARVCPRAPDGRRDPVDVHREVAAWDWNHPWELRSPEPIAAKCARWEQLLVDLADANDPRLREVTEAYHAAHIAYRDTRDADGFPEPPEEVVAT